MNIIKIAHTLWESHLKSLKKDLFCLVDATCGNGHDALFLSAFTGRLYCIDIQEKAIENTKKILKDKGVSYHQTSHEDLCFIKEPIDLIVYNLGYLPGSDKKIITTEESTILSLQSAIKKLSPKGMISIMIYTGHEGGKKEKDCIIKFLKTLPPSYSVQHITSPLKKNCPEILLIS